MILTKPKAHQNLKGLTLIEITIVLVVLLTLVGLSGIGIGAYRNWSLSKRAGEDLRSVHSAMRLYLADNPTLPASGVTAANITPYLPFSYGGVFPTFTDFDDNQIFVDFTTSPIVLVESQQADAVVYDPSGDPNDSLSS